MTITKHNEADVELVRSFANTLDVDDGTDELRSADAFTAWLRARDLLRSGGGQIADPGDLALARRLRAALRAEMAAHHDRSADPAARAELDRLAADLPVHLVFTEGAVEPEASGVRAALTRVLASAHALVREGAWERLKICPDDTCGWAFYDESRNRSRRWCSMDVCGNRQKVRAFRDREAAVARSPA